jgi:pimeloyl-ACP methyl ester carboxylesterase
MWDRSSLASVAPRIPVPALVLHDRDDTEIPYSDGVATAAAWRGADLVTTEGLGHFGILRDPAVIERVLRFTDEPQPKP